MKLFRDRARCLPFYFHRYDSAFTPRCPTELHHCHEAASDILLTLAIAPKTNRCILLSLVFCYDLMEQKNASLWLGVRQRGVLLRCGITLPPSPLKLDLIFAAHLVTLR